MNTDTLTPASDIAESYRAIRVAAQERRAALLAEVRELERMFPGLASNEPKSKDGQRGRPASEAVQQRRARIAEWLRANGPAGPRAIADALGLVVSSTDRDLRRDARFVRLGRGQWTVRDAE